MSNEVDALKIRVMDIPFKANGAGLTLSAVAASNIFADGRLQPAFVVPAACFFFGLIMSYWLMTIDVRIVMDGVHRDTILTARNTVALISANPNPDEEQRRVREEERARVDELQRKLITKPQLSRLILGVNITMNAALAAFCAGVTTAFLVLTGII